MTTHRSAVPVKAIGRGETVLYGAVFVLMFPPLFVVTLILHIGPRRVSGTPVSALIHEAAADAHSAISIALMDA